MENTLKGIKVFIAHQGKLLLDQLVSIAQRLDMKIMGQTSLAKDMEESCVAALPDLIISGVEFPDKPGIEALIAIAEVEPVPGLIIAKECDLENVKLALDDHVMAYLVDPVNEQDLEPSIYLVIKRFKEFQELREENANLKEVIATRKKMERAKGILMALYDLTEEDAYLQMRKVATDRRIKLSEVADLVITNAAKKKAVGDR